MSRVFYDLHVDSNDFYGLMRFAQRLGWGGVCISHEFDSGFGSYKEEINKVKKETNIDILAGAMISVKSPEEVQAKARLAIQAGADLVLVEGGDEEINRAASECWEVDVLCHPEKVSGKDLMDQKNSGIDHVMARFMAERCIALEINFSEILGSYGMGRSQVMARMRQNVMLAKKYGVPLAMTTGAQDKYCLRSPRDLLSVGLSLGMDEDLARKALTDHPLRIVKKSRDRKDPDLLLKGLLVTDWGASENSKRKKMSGWY